MKLSINLELASLAQLDGLQCALELYVDMETERARERDFTKTDAARLTGAREVLKLIADGRASK